MEGHIGEVRSFYDANTNRFLRWGSGSQLGAIRREVWSEGVATRNDALRYPDEQIAESITSLRSTQPQESLAVLDAGCGSGSSLLYLAEQYGKTRDTFVGCTLSSVQTAIAHKRLQEINPKPTCSFYTCSYLDLPIELKFDLIFGIESFVLGPDPKAFFYTMANHLLPGGILILIDDFLIDAGPGSKERQKILHNFKTGWLAQSLVTEEVAAALAAHAGLSEVKSENLTGALRLKRPRDYAIRFLYTVARDHLMRWHYTRALMGGHALQVALEKGWIGYFLKSWTKPAIRQ